MMIFRRGWAKAQFASNRVLTRISWRRLIESFICRIALASDSRRPRSAERFSMVCSWRSRHQIDVDLIELLGIDIELHIRQSQIGRDLRFGIPKDRLAVTGAVIDVDIHV